MSTSKKDASFAAHGARIVCGVGPALGAAAARASCSDLDLTFGPRLTRVGVRPAICRPLKQVKPTCLDGAQPNVMELPNGEPEKPLVGTLILTVIVVLLTNPASSRLSQLCSEELP